MGVQPRMRVGEVMTPSVVTVGPSTPFKDIARVLQAHHISAVPVLDERCTLLGVVSEEDLLRREDILAPSPGPATLWSGASEGAGDDSVAGALMTTPAVTIDADAPLARAARTMRDRDVKRLCVVDASGSLVGMVSRSDLLTAYLRSDRAILSEVDEVLRAWSATHPAAVAASVEDGVVRLVGTVGEDGDAAVLMALVAAVDGVVEVVGGLGARRVD